MKAGGRIQIDPIVKFGRRAPGPQDVRPLKLLPFLYEPPVAVGVRNIAADGKVIAYPLGAFEPEGVALIGILRSYEGAVLVGIGTREVEYRFDRSRRR